MSHFLSRLRSFTVRRLHIFYRAYFRGTRLGTSVAKHILKSGIVSGVELQASSLAQNSQIVDSPSSSEINWVKLEDDVPGLNWSRPLNFKIDEKLTHTPKINLMLPGLRMGNMSGGPNTALIVAALLVENHEHIRILCCDAPANGEERRLYDHIDKLMGRKIDRDLIEIVDSFDRTKSVSIGSNDLFFATAWWTAQIINYAIKDMRHKTFIYLIQDYEPILHEGSTLQARAEETYGFKHIPIVNTRLLFDHLVQQNAGLFKNPDFAENALWFEPALDRTKYFPDNELPKAQSGSPCKRVMLFYARPAIARRNLFEIGLVALRRLVAQGILDKDNWEIWAMGEKIDRVALGQNMFLDPLPWMDFDSYAKRVRTADLLLSPMLSPHPSYPPLEMAASGKIVVTNSFSVKTEERLKEISPNIYVANPTPDSYSKVLEEAVSKINAGLPSNDPSGMVNMPSDWDTCFKEIIPKLVDRINAIRNSFDRSSDIVSAGYPANPEQSYEHYRLQRLALRRQSGISLPEAGLLSFVTSAYDTDPVFLKELGDSLLSQDGHPVFEWVILDNGSTNPETIEVLKQFEQYPFVSFYRVEENLGIVGGMRYLLERATGRYILPLDSDDILEPDCVSTLTKFILDADYPALLYTDEDKLHGENLGAPYHKPDWDPVLFLHSCYIAHLCVIDREKALDLGLYTDSSADGCHDWDSFIRFMNAGYFPLHIPEVLYAWRIHEASTAGNISSKDYITKSHRATLNKALAARNVPNISLVNSPLFDFSVDWWFKRDRDAKVSFFEVVIQEGNSILNLDQADLKLDSTQMGALEELEKALQKSSETYVHVNWQGAVPDDDEWRHDAIALIELYPDTIMVGGTLHDGHKVIDGPRLFGFGDGFDCPATGRPLSDPGYSAWMWKARSVSMISCGHCVIDRQFLLSGLAELRANQVSCHMLGAWIGGLAHESEKRVVYSPFMRARASQSPENTASTPEKQTFLSRFWKIFPDNRYYSPRLALETGSAYLPAHNNDRLAHLKKIQMSTLAYPDWLQNELGHRSQKYPILKNSPKISIITPVYSGSDLALLHELAACLLDQSCQVHEWIIILNGVVPETMLDEIVNSAPVWKANIIVAEKLEGILPSMRLGLEKAEGEYVIPIDADDTITPDAIQIMSHAIVGADFPALMFSDEDILDDGVHCDPNLRAQYDPILAWDNSTIWHMCAMNREAALAAGVYGNQLANWCQDWDSISRIAQDGGHIHHVPEVLYHWRRHSNSTTNNESGDSRSLQSVEYILERQLKNLDNRDQFSVQAWPQSRGAKELYTARNGENLPKIIWYRDVEDTPAEDLPKGAIILFLAPGLFINGDATFLEVARLMELHSSIAAVGGFVVSDKGIILDGCGVHGANGNIEWPWQDQSQEHAGPYAIMQKPHRVLCSGLSFGFFRCDDIKRSGYQIDGKKPLRQTLLELCETLDNSDQKIAFSPQVKAIAGVGYKIQRQEASRISKRSSNRIYSPTSRYGLSRPFAT